MPTSEGVRAPRMLWCMLQHMLIELRENRLEVELVPQSDPVNEGACLRVATAHNPHWYQELCAAYPSMRKHKRRKHLQTKISRKRILGALAMLSAGLPSKSIYAEDLIDIARDLQQEVTDGNYLGEF